MKVKKRKLKPFEMRLLKGMANPAWDDANSAPVNDREEREMALALAAANQQNRFTNPMTFETMNESHPLSKDYIENTLFKNVNLNADSTESPWSAATVSDLAKAFDPSFEGSALHADYINRAFSGEGNYKADKIGRKTDFKAGDILFTGRGETEGDKFRGFKNRAKGGERYSSHSDIIVASGTDSKGRKYYDVQGGNVGDKLFVKRMYASDIDKKYAGRLTQ